MSLNFPLSNRVSNSIIEYLRNNILHSTIKVSSSGSYYSHVPSQSHVNGLHFLYRVKQCIRSMDPYQFHLKSH